MVSRRSNPINFASIGSSQIIGSGASRDGGSRLGQNSSASNLAAGAGSVADIFGGGSAARGGSTDYIA